MVKKHVPVLDSNNDEAAPARIFPAGHAYHFNLFFCVRKVRTFSDI